MFGVTHGYPPCALRWPPPAESGEAGQEWEALVTHSNAGVKHVTRRINTDSLEWCLQWGTSRGVWMVMIPGGVCGCINRRSQAAHHMLFPRSDVVRVFPIIFTFGALTEPGCGVEPCALIPCHGDKMTSRDSLNSPVAMTHVVKEQTMTDLLNSLCVSFIFAVNSWTKFLSYLITINKWAVRFIMTNRPLRNGPRQDYSTYSSVLWYTAVQKFGV